MQNNVVNSAKLWVDAQNAYETPAQINNAKFLTPYQNGQWYDPMNIGNSQSGCCSKQRQS